MKKFIISIVIAAGIVGLATLLKFKPKPTSTASATTPLNTSTTSSSASASTPSASSAGYKDGTYTGTAVDVGYGVVEVQAVVSSGKLTDINYISLPSGGHSSMVSSVAGPQLRSEALQAQSANVDIVSGATSTSEGFQQSLQAALNQAS